jgi:hypothetical protein
MKFDFCLNILYTRKDSHEFERPIVSWLKTVPWLVFNLVESTTLQPADSNIQRNVEVSQVFEVAVVTPWINASVCVLHFTCLTQVNER